MKHSAFFPFLLFGSLLFLLGSLFAFFLPAFPPDPLLSAFFSSEPYPALTPAIRLLTHLNAPPAVAVSLLLILGVLLRRGLKRQALFALGAVVGTALLNSLLKSLLRRPRPDLRLVEIHSPSFPSWHSATSAALALTLWILFIRPLPPGPLKSFWSILLLLWPLLIGFSRLFLNTHWASDILAGWGLGIGVTALLASILLPRGEGHRGSA